MACGCCAHWTGDRPAAGASRPKPVSGAPAEPGCGQMRLRPWCAPASARCRRLFIRIHCCRTGRGSGRCCSAVTTTGVGELPRRFQLGDQRPQQQTLSTMSDRSMQIQPPPWVPGRCRQRSSLRAGCSSGRDWAANRWNGASRPLAGPRRARQSPDQDNRIGRGRMPSPWGPWPCWTAGVAAAECCFSRRSRRRLRRRDRRSPGRGR
jgi:hypothetical protein